jgi:hypothetical protein
MSIFKETFPKFVTEQLKIREKIISSGAGKTDKGFNFNENRENDFFTYTLNKQCTLRMSSGVNVTDQDLLKDLTNSDQNTLPGKTLAEQFVLQGGVKTSNLQGGIGEGGAYGDPNLAANSRGDGLGIVPMPGIIDATINTKSAYGSLREAKVKFVAHNKKQLQILETLYMRPGYTLLLEWGWSPYFILDDSGNRTKQNTLPFISNFFNSNTSTTQLEKDIFSKKEDSQGNYDALLGYCKNFSYSLRPDGGFNCETEIIAKGEIIESLKDQEFKTTSLSENINFTYSPSTLIFLEKLRQYSVTTADASNLTLFGSFSYDGLSGAFGSEERRKRALFEDDLGKDLEFETSIESELEDLKKFIITKGDEDKGWSLGTNRDAIRAETSYIRWDALCFLFNKYSVPTNDKGEPLFLLQTNRLSNDGTKIEPLKYVDIVPNVIREKAKQLEQKTWVKKDTNGNDQFEEQTLEINWNNADLSINPQMFQFPHTLFKQPIGELGDFPKKIYNKLYQPLAKQLADTSPKDVVIDNPLNKEEINYSIGGIFIGVEYLISTFKSMYYDEIGAIKDDYSLFNFIKKIWEDINGACNNNHEFDIHVENGASGKILRVVDFIVDAGEVDLENVHELKIQSLDSTVRDIVYNTNLPSSLSTTIAVAAQAPDSIDNLDKVSFAAISENIQDRFATPVKTDNTPTQEQIDRWKSKWDASLKSLKSITYKFSDSQFSYLGELNKFVIEVDEKANQYSDEDSFEDFSKHRGAAGQVRKSIEYLYKVYGYTDTDKNIYQGQPIPDPVPRLSAVIPLQFNLKLDGISGIVIGNVFKLPKNRLPFSYREDDIYFIVMGEEQSVSSKQDWTTSIKGQLILLRKESERNNLINENWNNLSGILTTTLTEKEVREEKDGEDAWKKYVTDTPWSAAFISSMVKQAGDNTFPFDASHSNYATRIKNGESNNWKAIDPLTTPLRHGDIIVYNTDSSAYQWKDFAENAPFNSHGDIVVGINANSESVILIGGNLSNSVIKKTLSTTAGDSLKWKDGLNANTAAYIPVRKLGKSVAVNPEITTREITVDGKTGTFDVERFVVSAPVNRLKENYYVVLRCNDDNIIRGMLKNANAALSEFQNGAIKENDDRIAETIYNYYRNCNLNPPLPSSLKAV